MVDFLRHLDTRRWIAVAAFVALVGGLVLIPATSSRALGATFTVNTTADPSAGSCSGGSGSLRQCLAAAAAVAGADTVDFAVDGVFTLSLGTLVVASDVTIRGNGPANTILDGNHTDRVVFVASPSIVTVSGTTIRNGTSTQNTGDGAEGAGVLNLGTLTLSNVAVRGNSSVGALAGNPAATVAVANGGGVFNGGTMTISDSTVSGNNATATSTGPGSNSQASGGGIFSIGGGITTLTNVTISGNQAHASAEIITEQGGGIIEVNTGTATNVTVTDNTAALSSGVDERGDMPFKKSIVAGNHGGANCRYPALNTGFNLDNDGSCFGGPTDRHGNPLLGPLADNNGPTQTHALLPGSPAIDAVASGCPPPSADQRGVSRPQGTACDIGAFEVVNTTPPTTTTTSATTTTVAPTTTTTTAATTTTTAAATTTTTAPAATTCVVTGLRAGPPKQQDVSVQNLGGLASISNIQIVNGTVNAPAFTPGTTAPVVVTATKSDPNQSTVWSFDAIDIGGHTTHCG